MALINSSDVRTIPIPHEPDQWVKVRPLTLGDTEDITREANGDDLSLARRILLRTLVDWSYGVEITDEALRSLDRETGNWLINELNLTSGVRTDPEKKDSNGNSSTTPPSEEQDSPPSLGI